MPVSKNLPCTILTSALSARRFLWAAALVPDVLWSLIRPLPPSFNAETARWSTTCIRPSLPHGYSVRTPKWHFLGDAAETIGLRFWNDLLVAFTRLGVRRIWDLTQCVLRNWLSRDGQIATGPQPLPFRRWPTQSNQSRWLTKPPRASLAHRFGCHLTPALRVSTRNLPRSFPEYLRARTRFGNESRQKRAHPRFRRPRSRNSKTSVCRDVHPT